MATYPDPSESELIVLVPGLLSARLETAEAVLRVRLSGQTVGRDSGVALGNLFDRALARARAGARGIVLHFENMNGLDWAGIAALVRFFRAASEEGVGLTVVYDAKQAWQSSSFESLRRALRSAGGPDVNFTRA